MTLSIPQNIFTRTAYVERVIPFIGQNIIKVFTGQRRVGKSYLMFQIMNHILGSDPKANIIYINKEDLEFSDLKNAADLNNYILSQKSAHGKSYVFIDEIQDIEDFHAALRSLLLDSSLDLYCTGSNAQLLSSDLAGYLSGRSIQINVYSLSFPEFIAFHELDNNDESLTLYMKYGGLPFLKHLGLQEEVVFEYLRNIRQTVVYKDVVGRYNVRNTAFLDQLISFIAGHIGSLFSAKKISDFLKSQRVNIAPNQVQQYLEYLTQAFLLHKADRYDIQGKRIFEVGTKYYFENLGIRNAIWGFKAVDLGKIIENVVYNHLLYRGYQVYTGTLGAEEIDFVCEKNGEKLYLQVALSITEEQTLLREFGNLMKINDNFLKKVITLSPFSGNSYEGIESISLFDFLNQS